MARRRKRNELSVSLFPFLSVLSCVIGTLTLMIAASAVGRVAEDLEARAPTPPISSDVLVQPEEIARFASRLRQAEMQGEELEALRSELRALGLDPELDAKTRARKIQERIELARLLARVEELGDVQLELDQTLAALRSESSARAKRASEARIALQPHGESHGLVPFFVECRDEGIRIHRTGLEQAVSLEIDDLAELARFQAFLRRVRVTRGGIVIFLVRPDGVASYRNALARTKSFTVRHGVLPLPGDGRLDFSLL